MQKTAKFAGWAYFLIITTSVLSIVFGPYRLEVEGDMAKTIENIAANQALYRIGIVYEILMYTGVIGVFSSLYRLRGPPSSWVLTHFCTMPPSVE